MAGSEGFEWHESRYTTPQLDPVVFHAWSRRERVGFRPTLSSGWMMSGQLNSFYCGFDPRWFEEDLGSKVVFWVDVAYVHDHSPLAIPLRSY